MEVAHNQKQQSVESLADICRSRILLCLEKKRFALKLLTKVFISMLPYRLLLLELLVQFYSEGNLRVSSQAKDGKQHYVLLWLEEKDPELLLHTNQIWGNFANTQTEEISREKKEENGFNEDIVDLLLHSQELRMQPIFFKQLLAQRYEASTSFKALYLRNLRKLEKKKLIATANIIKLQRDLQSERDSKSIVVLDNLEMIEKKMPNKKIIRSKLFQKSLNQHKTDIKKFKPTDSNSNHRDPIKKKESPVTERPKIKRVKL